MTAKFGAPPQLTILLPVHNAEKWLAACLESLLTQTISDFEIFLLDDGSTDGTSAIARRYALADRRVQVFPMQKARYLSEVLNSQLDRVRSEWVARMDADDLSDPRRFEAMLAHVRRHPEIDILGTQVRVIDRESRATIGQIRPPSDPAALEVELLFRNPVVHPSVILRTRTLRKLGGYPSAPYAEDYALWTQAVQSGLQLATLDQVLLDYGRHAAQVTQRHRAEALNRAHEISTEYASWFFRDLEPENRRRAQDWVALAVHQSIGGTLDGAAVSKLSSDAGVLLETKKLSPGHSLALKSRVQALLHRFAEPTAKRYFAPQAQDYDSRLIRRTGGYERGVPSWIGDTEKLWSFARNHGLASPRGLFTCDRADLKDQPLPESMVLITTPTRSNYGDAVLTGPEAGVQRASIAASQFEEEFARYTNDPTVIVADPGIALRPELEVYRFFASYGEISAVLRDIRTQDEWRVSLWNGAFGTSAGLRFRAPSQGRIVEPSKAPKDWPDLAHAARILSMVLPTAFARIDIVRTLGEPLILGAQLYPAQFTPSHSLEADDELLDFVANRWGDAERWLAAHDLAPPARWDPRPGDPIKADTDESE